MPNDIKDATDYATLRAVLDLAYEQSSSGKGKNRHANGKSLLQQPIMEIGRMVGLGYHLGQAMKKAQEASGMASRGEVSAAQAELLGAINYLAAAHILLGETEAAPEAEISTVLSEPPAIRFTIAPEGICQSCARSTEKPPSPRCQLPDGHQS